VGDVEVLNCLKQCLRDNTIHSKIGNYAGSLHTIAASCINSLFTSNITEYTQAFCIDYFTNLLSDPSIAMVNKKQLHRALKYCLENCFEAEYVGMWKKLTNELLLSEQLLGIGLLLLTAFCQSEMKENLIEELDEKPFEFSMSVITRKERSL
jgi:hypothetical protein